MSKKKGASLEDLLCAITEDMSAADLLESAILIDTSRSIRSARKKKGWSQKDFAEHMNVTQSLVSRWESGECNYTIRTLAEISVCLDLEMDLTLRPSEFTGNFTLLEAETETDERGITFDPFAWSSDFDWGGVA